MHSQVYHLRSLPALQENQKSSPLSSGKLGNVRNAKISTRYLSRRLRALLPLLLLILCFYKSFRIYLTAEIDPTLLEYNALVQQNQSLFNPKDIALDVYNYLIEQQQLQLQLQLSLQLSSLQQQQKQQVSDSTLKIGTDKGIYFHWDDWVDLDIAKQYLTLARSDSSLETQCDASLIKYGKVSGHWLESYNTKINRGAVNLYCLKEIPEKVIVTTDKWLIEIPVIAKRRFGTLKSNQVQSNQLITKLNQINTTSLPQFRSRSTTHLQKKIMIEPEEFIFKPDVEIFALQEKLNNQTISKKELEYLEFLEYSNNHLVDYTDRYFKYPWIYSDIIQGNAHHMAYPFFKRYISDRERQSVLHHMVRAWFQFAETNGFASWINYGSLLGWSFNGVNMPWDTDIDVQMPIAQLDKLGREFNKTLVMENPKYGNARYWLEISPTYIRQGNGKNHIDARFIDIHTGLYIDITALSHTEVPPPAKHNMPDNLSTMLVHCKNWNWHTLDELLPIRHTYFEGASVYIPNKVNQLLTNKYGKGALTDYNVYNHNYQPDISMWVSDRICKEAPKEEVSRFNRWQGLTRAGACNSPKLQDEYKIIRQSIRRHYDLNQDLDSSIYYDIEQLEDLPISRKDSWDYYNDINQGLVHDDDWFVEKTI
ncbi:hypothetical protein KGF56_001414 [Candida oxycetoniae]|uniref:LicD/FKTN/FKRP nucleotidyltransferase domain-containing protein n=1 Tax=Candida oxycetoniae TaxID=497107 RepID=A0AAI9SZT2_9ASCO|nr:uncharacterized protein KGF56_001414 [Candida oxycetoniae]KAI3405807.2 hypothetical protein KGF56_001414 [Candida oxycetoniae]